MSLEYNTYQKIKQQCKENDCNIKTLAIIEDIEYYLEEQGKQLTDNLFSQLYETITPTLSQLQYEEIINEMINIIENHTITDGGE